MRLTILVLAGAILGVVNPALAAKHHHTTAAQAQPAAEQNPTPDPYAPGQQRYRAPSQKKKAS
jgi:hypothetical protein